MKFKENAYRVLKSSAFITLFATTIGVLIAFYLEGLNSRISLENRKEKAITNLEKELTQNRKDLKKVRNDSLITYFKLIQEHDKLLEGEMIASRQEMDSILSGIPI